MGGAGAHHRVQTENRLVGVAQRQPMDQVISVPTAHALPAGASSMALIIFSVEPAASAAWTTSMVHSGCTIT